MSHFLDLAPSLKSTKNNKREQDILEKHVDEKYWEEQKEKTRRRLDFSLPEAYRLMGSSCKTSKKRKFKSIQTTNEHFGLKTGSPKRHRRIKRRIPIRRKATDEERKEFLNSEAGVRFKNGYYVMSEEVMLYDDGFKIFIAKHRYCPPRSAGYKGTWATPPYIPPPIILIEEEQEYRVPCRNSGSYSDLQKNTDFKVHDATSKQKTSSNNGFNRNFNSMIPQSSKQSLVRSFYDQSTDGDQDYIHKRKIARGKTTVSFKLPNRLYTCILKRKKGKLQ